MNLKKILFVALFLSSIHSFTQDVAHPLEIPDSCLFVPNAITPDCDQVDCGLLTIYFQCEITDFKLVIYNTYGEIVFESTDIENKWSSDEVEGDGVFVWEITGTMSDAGTPFAVSKTGHLVVLK